MNLHTTANAGVGLATVSIVGVVTYCGRSPLHHVDRDSDGTIPFHSAKNALRFASGNLSTGRNR